MLRLPVRGGPAGGHARRRRGAARGADPGWVTDGEPVYRVTQDKAAAETAVTFGASSG